MFRNRLCHRSLLTTRLYSTEQQKPSIKLVAELRKLTEVSLSKAREALAATNNDVQRALAWLENDLVSSGAKKAAKVEGRVAEQGLISVSVLSPGASGRKGAGVRAAMIELNCETDFVSRNELFGKLAADIAHTAAFISEPADSDTLIRSIPLDLLHDAPLISASDPASRSNSTIATSIRDLIAKVGEKVSLRRVSAVVTDPLRADMGLRLGSYLHGSIGQPTQGRIGTLALLALASPNLQQLLASEAFIQDMERLERSLARQITGFETKTIRSSSEAPEETALYDQQFMMLAGNSGVSVREELELWATEKGLTQDKEKGGIEVMEFAKWTVGESL